LANRGQQPAGPMVKVKKILKKKAEAEDAPEAPAKSPKMSPKMSPKAEKTAEPKKEAKKAKKEPKGDAAPVSDEEKARLTKEAVEVILKGIAKPDAQVKGAYVPVDWNAKFKGALGGYKKFCSGQTGVLQVVAVGGANFHVLKHGEKAPPATARGAGDWKSQLLGSWSAYCKATPENDRSQELFLAPLPSGIKKTAPEGTAKASPKMSPKVEAAPAGDGGKKRKAEADAAPKEKALAPKKKKAKKA